MEEENKAEKTEAQENIENTLRTLWIKKKKNFWSKDSRCVKQSSLESLGPIPEPKGKMYIIIN